MDLKQIANDIVSPERAGRQGFPHDCWTTLRAGDPLPWLEPDGYDPFWAVTKHADLKEIATQPEKFLNEPRPIIGSRKRDRLQKASPVKTLINMDAPEHRIYRRFVNSWFVPKNLIPLENRMRESARQLVGMMAEAGTWEGDFVADIAAFHPVRLITHILGVGKEDEAFVIRLANEVFGSEDPEFQRGTSGSEASVTSLMMEAFQFFSRIANERKKNPTDDLASAIANAEFDGKPISMSGIIGYYLILLTAGHETTRTAMSGAVHALMENPGELRKLRENPAFLDSAVEEVVRWTSPVNQFARTATEDYELRGRTIKAGQAVCLFYGSANRDEEVFDNPFEFHVDRNPNPHLGYGIGAHFCLGASLARMEMKVFFEELIPRLDPDSLELSGTVEYLASNFVGGIKHLPIRCKVA